MTMDEISIESLSCNMCETADDLIFCEGCEAYYCDDCWEKLKSHRKQGRGAAGVPHGKSRPEIVQTIKASMSEPKNDVEEVKQHLKDADSIWFGLSQDDGGEPALADYRRYASVILESNPEVTGPRYPGLVSFIGPTGSGKSTLIKLLIDSTRHVEGGGDVAVPVIGRNDSETPTSADVHLYIDPDTTSGERPILFADCEGFEGGERDPVAQQKTAGARPSSHKPSPPYYGDDGGPAHEIKRVTHAVKKRVLRWALRTSQHSEQTSKRQFAVTEMYPRIFHAFSDVIVFMLNNPKTIEDVVEKLIKWADANHSTSINMPCKPHAIIAINKSHNSSPEEYWLPAQTTEDFFKSMNDQLNKNPTLREYAEKWRLARAPIHDMRELFSRYYWTTTVVRLPEKSRYELMYRQRDALKDVIQDRCQQSFNKRKDVSILPDVDEFGMYLSLAFDHFSETLEKPFDYVKASIQYRPPPETLDGNLFEFVLVVAEALHCEGEIEQIFNTITKVVASYFILDSARKQRMGQPQDWFEAQFSDLCLHGNTAASAARSYQSICNSVVEEYFKSRVTCQFKVDPGSNLAELLSDPYIYSRGFKCELVQAGHNEGLHRMKWRGHIWGNFFHKFQPSGFAWATKILDEFQPLHGEYMADSDDRHTTPRQKAARGHGRQLKRFYSSQTMFSNRICLGCLFNAPTIRLRCGHVICYECALDFGRRDSGTQMLMDYCPLHPGQAEENAEKPDVIQLDPLNAGLRVLVLDGGGVRGIAELCVLKEIEEHLKMPLQEFFDLVVGTSTGGIISLGFGHEMWSIDDCIRKFTSLVSAAFNLRSVQKIQGLKYLERLIKKSKYKTRPFEEALQSVFSDAALFAPRRRDVEHASDSSDSTSDSTRPGRGMQPLRVAVAAVSGAGRVPYLLSNYHVGKFHTSGRPNRSKTDGYERARPTKDAHELHAWEAARATSAAPGFFKPFESKRLEPPFQFMDGAILHNNPIQLAMEETRRLSAERRLNLKPDIMLSIGTGQPKDHSPASELPTSGTLSREKIMIKHQKKLPFLQMMFTMLSYQVKLNIDCERRYEQVTREWAKDPDWEDRLHRINPDLGKEPPPLDAVEEVDSIAQSVRGWLQHPEEKRRIHAVACKLAASSFYFERRGNAGKIESSSAIHLQGTIRCRLAETTAITALGKFLAACLHEPALVIINYSRPDEEIALPVDTMLSHGRFDGVGVDFTVSGEETVTSIELKLEREGLQDQRLYHLSGFPRKLVKEDFKQSQVV